MAGGVAITPGTGNNFEGRITTYVILASLVAASGGLLFGYDIGVTGGVTTNPYFLSLFFPSVLTASSSASADVSTWCKFDSQLLQLFTSSLFLSGIGGAAVASRTTSGLGRVTTMRIAGVFFLAGAALTGGAPTTTVLVFGRLSLGLGVGLANQAVPLYLSEIAPAKARGALNIMFQMATTIGILAGQLICYWTLNLDPWGWRLALALAGVPALILTIGSFLLPETPNSLLERGYLSEGKEVLQRLRGKEIDINDEYEDILRACNRASNLQSFSHLLSKKYRSELTWAVVIPAFQQLTGINAIMFYCSPLFNSLGFGDSASLYSAVIIGIVNVFATFISIGTVDRFGRKVLFLWGGIIMILMQISIAIALAIGFQGGTSNLSPSLASGLVALICIYVSGFACSWGPLGWLVPSEIQPMETRSAGQAVTVATNFLFTFIVGQAFLSMLCYLRWGIFLFFGAWVVLMTIVVQVFLPETKGIPIEDMSYLWDKVSSDENLEGASSINVGPSSSE